MLREISLFTEIRLRVWRLSTTIKVTKKILLTTEKEKEKAILVCTTVPKSSGNREVKQKVYKEHLEELEFLTKTAGAEVVYKVYQERNKIDASFYIGKGKAEEIAAYAEENNIDLVIFENQLSPTQIRNLEKLIKCKIIDKPALILDIFATNARTSEAKTQVELAQLQYLLPRLTRQWTHLSKQYGGVGVGMKGPGETQIETDRRLINIRIATLKDKLKKIEEQRKIQRQQRSNFFRISLVGYTNAGKSTLLNTLTDADVYVEDKLFATLDTSTRLLKEINEKKLKQPVLISDTVGFIRNLPHDLIESFKSTLAEVIESDMLIHIVDVSSESFEEQIQVVNETLEDLGAHTKKIILTFNKIDKLGDDAKEIISELNIKYPGSIFISAEKAINLDSLSKKVIEALDETQTTAEIVLNSDLNHAYKYVNELHEQVEILDTKYLEDSIKLIIKGNKPVIQSILNKVDSLNQKKGKL
jgi:GTP-binding protein HflX